MKKAVLAIILCFPFLNSCSNLPVNQGINHSASTAIQSTATAENPDSTQIADVTSAPEAGQSSGQLCNESDVEENINCISLSEDEKLTEAAEINNVTEKDILISNIDVKIPLIEDGEQVVRQYNTLLPPEIIRNIQYSKYPVAADYLLITSNTANIREFPSSSSKIIGTASLYEKITLLAEVTGEKLEKYNTDKWYKVLFKVGSDSASGYILSSLGVQRTYQFQEMYDSVKLLEKEIDFNKSAYINNYKNRAGAPPLHHGSSTDAFGTKRYQSAPAYYEAASTSEFRYISDGTLVSIISEEGDFYKIITLTFEGNYYVPKKYISFNNSIEKLKKVIVVDRNNQNEGVFELIDGKWNIISYIYATTGEDAKFKEPTSLGYYMAIQTRDRFLYLDDITKKVGGYAPYAIRFSGGAYIHGVPVDVKTELNVPVFQPMQEYLFTIGSVPRSHKCVRNYTSHAKFLYEWIEIGKSAVVVIE